jgi:hypothetical protein
MNGELKGKWNKELGLPIEAMFEHQKLRRTDQEAERADRMTRWLVLTLCALCASAALHWQQANNLRTSSETIIALQKEVYALQSKPLKGGQP